MKIMKNDPIKSAAIYYFSGTGNAQKTTSWMANSFREKGIQAEIINIDSHRTKEHVNNNFDLIGFCSPTHGFNFPPVVLNFITRFPKGKGQKVFLVNTRAGMKMGKLFLPGLSGIAQLFSALILFLKGYRIVGMQPIDMPSNWISIHPGIKLQVATSIMHRCKIIVEKFALRIANGEKDFRALFDIVQDLMIAPISLGYYLVGRFIFAKSFYADRNCTLCYKCIKECPVSAIKKIDSRPFWTHHCESCMHCMNNCPVNAIQTAHGMVAGTLYVSISVILKLVWEILLKQTNSPFIDKIYEVGMLKFTIESIVAIFFLILAYRIMHFLLKIPFFERFISYTSLTSYRFWRRFKSPKINAI